MDQFVSRRTLLVGAGGTAAATIGSVAVATGATNAVAGSPFLPSEGASVAASGSITLDSLTTGLAYVTVDGAGFFPENPMAAPRFLGSVGGASTTPVNALLTALTLPVGSVLKEVTIFYVAGAAAAPAPMFAIFKKPFAGAYAPLGDFTTLPMTLSTQTLTVTFNEPIDGSAAYLADFVVRGESQVIGGMLLGYQSAPVFVGMSPIARVLDTRITGGKLQPNEERIVSLGVPGTVSAAIINLTVTETETAGWVAVFRADAAFAGNSSINWSQSDQNIANGVTTAVDAAGQIKIRGGVHATHVVIDVQGFLQ